jgi:hypothetical protein
MSSKNVNEGVKGFRYRIGADILLLMDAKKEFPVSNVHRLGKTMMEYFKENTEYLDELKKEKYKWRPSADYFMAHLPDFRKVLRMEKKYFEFVREDGTITGFWIFADKKMYEANLKREGADIATRTETFNDKLEDGQKKWKLQIAHLDLVPLQIEA